jgi:hypothetical protein
MNEEIEYAEMLEIPVSTVNVIHKKRRKKAQKEQPTAPTLKDSVIAQVNTRIEDQQVSADAAQFAESANSQGYVDFSSVPERVDTVRLFADETERKNAYAESFFPEPEMENDGGMYEVNEEEPRAKKVVRLTLGIEFAAACALCGAIFLTNVFMPNSAVNTFFRAIHNPAVSTSDTRTYSDFTLSPVVSELSDAEFSLSSAGILSFKDECCVYPAVDGEVQEVVRNEDGTFTLKIEHSDSFTGVIAGLNQVYYEVGDSVKSNVPVGYTQGEIPVQVTMYSGGVLLNCFQLNEENCLAWVEE